MGDERDEMKGDENERKECTGMGREEKRREGEKDTTGGEQKKKSLTGMVASWREKKEEGREEKR